MYTKDTRASLEARNKDLQADFRNVRTKVSETRDAINQTARDARLKAQDFLQSSLDGINERTADIQDNVVSYVKTNPVKSVGIAIFAGLILSKLLRK
ncbi:MAG: hypothetical protein P4M14_05120 [Gammaproteobacteria bacterium]|nr:hypothetical protein [Gammaproteobacteria bacterium]